MRAALFRFSEHRSKRGLRRRLPVPSSPTHRSLAILPGYREFRLEHEQPYRDLWSEPKGPWQLPGERLEMDRLARLLRPGSRLLKGHRVCPEIPTRRLELR